MQDARIGTGTGSVYVAHNRLRTNPDGSVTWFERNLTHVPTSPVDPTVSVIRIDRADGTPIAVLTNYACHPVVFGPDNLRYSADFPAVMNSTVEHEVAGGVSELFPARGSGRSQSVLCGDTSEQDAIKWRDWTGETLGREAARVAKQIHTDADPHPRIDFREETMNVRLRWNEEKFRAALVKFMGPKALDEYGNKIKPEFPISRYGCSHQSPDCFYDRARRAIRGFPNELARPLSREFELSARLHKRILRLFPDHSGSIARRLRSSKREYMGRARYGRAHSGPRGDNDVPDAGVADRYTRRITA